MDLTREQRATADESMAAIKRGVFADNPAPTTALDEIRRLAAAFDRVYAMNPVFTPMEAGIVDVMWKACGSPVLEPPAPIEPPPEPEPEP
jgi:hypothetical protein